MTTRLGILGGGQLAAMLGRAAVDLGIPTRMADPHATAALRHDPRFQHVDTWRDALHHLTQDCSVITWEREDLPSAELAEASDLIRPGIPVMHRCQDRRRQKELLDRLELATAAWLPIGKSTDLQRVIDTLGLPLMVKARTGGFDGRGQCLVHSLEELQAAQARFMLTGSIAEQFIDFDDEWAALVTRDRNGAQVAYPLVLTHQEAGQLSWAWSPHPRSEEMQSWCIDAAGSIAHALDHVGTLAVEGYRCGEHLLINEIAPRVHNSGHATIEGCLTSQFSNHVRAVTGQQLGSTRLLQHCLLLNCIGSMPTPAESQGLSRHDYNKQARPGRKVGHLVLTGQDDQQLLQRMQALPGGLADRYTLPRRIPSMSTVGV